MGETGKSAETSRDAGGETGKAEVRAARRARLSAAMRENLKRRKAQVRGRAGPKSGHADKSGVR
jgi:hypothetical protein